MSRRNSRSKYASKVDAYNSEPTMMTNATAVPISNAVLFGGHAWYVQAEKQAQDKL
jgi:hypothetical protein